MCFFRAPALRILSQIGLLTQVGARKKQPSLAAVIYKATD